MLGYSGENPDNTITFDFELLRTVGVFTKQRGDTALSLDWSAHSTRIGGFFCHYQLRIDGKSNDGSSSLLDNNASEGNVVTYATNESISTFAEFPGLAAGNHTVQIYVRGSATACQLNTGNFNQQILVEEYLASTLSTFDSPVLGGEDEVVQGGR